MQIISKPLHFIDIFLEGSQRFIYLFISKSVKYFEVTLSNKYSEFITNVFVCQSIICPEGKCVPQCSQLSLNDKNER
jgi:hypothetical protein